MFHRSIVALQDLGTEASCFDLMLQIFLDANDEFIEESGKPRVIGGLIV